MKLYPNHGPSEEPANPIKDENTKKISSALSTMPIIPLARTQLEELVKKTVLISNFLIIKQINPSAFLCLSVCLRVCVCLSVCLSREY
jgi:hypothetical protein